MTRVTWLGHSTVLLETSGLQVLTDPFLEQRIGPVRRRAAGVDLDLSDIDVVVISHLQGAVVGPDAHSCSVVVFVPKDRLRPWLLRDIWEVHRRDR